MHPHSWYRLGKADIQTLDARQEVLRIIGLLNKVPEVGKHLSLAFVAVVNNKRVKRASNPIVARLESEVLLPQLLGLLLPNVVPNPSAIVQNERPDVRLSEQGGRDNRIVKIKGMKL